MKRPPKQTLKDLQHLRERLDLLKKVDDFRDKVFILYRELLKLKAGKDYLDIADSMFGDLSDKIVELLNEISVDIQTSINHQQ